MAEAGVALALETLRDLLVEEGRFLLGVRSRAKALKTRLQEIKNFLRDADRKQHESHTVRNWILQIRDLAYRAEDVILEYAVRKSSEGRRRGFKRLLSLFSIYSLRQIGCEISDIESELSRITSTMGADNRNRIIHGAENSIHDNQNWERKTFPGFAIEDCFVGKEKDVKRLENLLVKDSHHRVISVWGMGGIGKTTIAKKVFDLMKTQNQWFDSFAWVCITQQCQIRSVLEDVLKQLDGGRGEGVSSLSETQLVEELCEVQTAKRCMIVMDDLWKTSQWEGLKHAFVGRSLRSKILVTTRNQKVAEIGFSHEVGLLGVADGWELLKKKAFPHNIPAGFQLDQEWKRIGEEMVRRCGCLPLAISLLGGVLSNKSCMKKWDNKSCMEEWDNKSCMEEWELVNENINASLYEGEGIEKVMKLSYEDLPYYLKPCFLYLGRLKEDETIYSANLYRMWIAQGMISEDNNRGKTLTDIAEDYLTELASRCIVQVEAEDVIPLQKHRVCKLHDAVRDVCLSLGEQEGFGVRVFDYEGGKFSSLLHESLSAAKTRHLVIHVKSELQLHRDEHTIGLGCKNLRSLEILSEKKRDTIEFPPQRIVNFRKFKFLRGLVIFRFKFEGRKLPRGITDLVHLRYLSLRKCELDSLPSSMSNLAYLDTLDLSDSWNVRIPEHVLKKLSRLKHLLLPSYDAERIGNHRLKLDECTEELESLIGYDSMVNELQSTTRMENLRRFSATIRDIESLSTITNAIAIQWTKLSYCTVSIGQGCKLTATEEGKQLKQALSCPHLYNLRIQVELGKLLEECISDIISSKLVKLTLIESEIEDDPMGTLGKLPFLRELYLLQRCFVGEVMTCHASSFPLLKKVVLQNLPKLREWRVEKGAMPLVSEVCLRRCHRLKKVPDGLRSISKLQKLEIRGMERLGNRVLASGADFHKVRHIPSIIISK